MPSVNSVFFGFFGSVFIVFRFDTRNFICGFGESCSNFLPEAKHAWAEALGRPGRKRWGGPSRSVRAALAEALGQPGHM